MSESSDYSPGVWKGHDFKSAKAAYAKVIDRGYGDAVAKGVDADSLVAESLVCEAQASLTIITDVTGSMDEWPKTMFSKLPYLELETKQYLGENTEIGFAAVGDANSDKYPLQVCEYTSGLDLKTKMESLIIEGGGGGQDRESYELAALYYARNVTHPKATHPILIIIGDENYYDVISPDQAKRYAKVILPERITAKDVFDELMRKYSVYLIRKPYGRTLGDKRSTADQHIHDSWVKLLGEDRIVTLPKAERVVDVIFGILAKETDRIPYFQMELEARQEADKVDTVYKSLSTVHIAAAAALPAKAGHSTMRTTSLGEKTKSLLG